MRALLLAAVLIVATLPAFAVSGTTIKSPDLEAAQAKLDLNLSLGRKLEGKPITPGQAAQLQSLVDEGMERAKAGLAQYPQVAWPHDLVGAFLCLAYYPTTAQTAARPTAQAPTASTVLILRRGAEAAVERKRGLAEIEQAAHLHTFYTGFSLDYAEALLLAGEGKAALGNLNALWSQMSKSDGWRGPWDAATRARAARLLARGSAALGKKQDEGRWLTEVLRNDPNDETARSRLAELTHSAAPPAAEIAWQDYESGMSQARRDAKSIMIDFMASWCGWCKKLDDEVYTDPDVIEMSAHFICIKVDVEQRSDLARVYSVTALPTIIFLGHTGVQESRANGYLPTQGFLEKMRKSLPPEK